MGARPVKRITLVIVLIVCFASRYSAAPAYADCLGPNPTATPQPSYSDAVLAVDPSHLIALWKLNEIGGTTAADSSGNGYSGTYNAPTLNATTFTDGSPAPSFDGINDYVDVYSSGLASAFSASEGTFFAWVKVASSGTWSDASTRYVLRFQASSSNFVYLAKTTTANRLQAAYGAGGTTKSVNTAYSGTGWFSYAITWSKSADQVKVYLNGSQDGSTQTGLGTFSGSLGSANAVIGAQSTGAGSPWSGNLSYVMLFSTALSSGNISTLNNAFAISPTATPYPTCTPSPTNTPTPTGSPSPTITLTPSLTLTPSNTAALIHFWTLPPPETTGTPQPGQNVGFEYLFTGGQAAISILLAILIFSLIAMFVILLLTSRRS